MGGRQRPPGEMIKTEVARPKVTCATCHQFDGRTWCRRWNFYTAPDSPPCRFYRRTAPRPSECGDR